MLVGKNEIILNSGLRVSMPVAGVIRVTDGNHKKSFAVSAKLRKRPFEIDGDRVLWGKIALEPDNGMALYLDGKRICRDHTEKKPHTGPLSLDELEILKAEGHLNGADIARLSAQWSIEVFKELGPDDAVYGLGDKTGDRKSVV